MMVKSVMARVGIVLIGMLAVVLGRGFFYYSGFYSAPPIETPGDENVAVAQTPSTEYRDVYEQQKGTILVDLAHGNDFNIEELNVLTFRLISRGLTIEFFRPGDNLKKKLLGKDEEEKESNQEEPKVASAYVIVCPKAEFSR